MHGKGAAADARAHAPLRRSRQSPAQGRPQGGRPLHPGPAARRSGAARGGTHTPSANTPIRVLHTQAALPESQYDSYPHRRTSEKSPPISKGRLLKEELKATTTLYRLAATLEE